MVDDKLFINCFFITSKVTYDRIDNSNQQRHKYKVDQCIADGVRAAVDIDEQVNTKGYAGY